MSTISNDRIQQIMTRCVPFHGECAAPVSVIEVKAMATELLALRKERGRAEPVVVPDCFLNAVSALESLYRNGQKQCWHERYTTDMAYASGVLNACRAAMLKSGNDDIGSWSNHKNTPTDKPKSEMSQKAEQLLRDTTALAATLSAETETTAQQFESLAGKAVGGWIPCSERMPVEKDIVLVVDDGYFVCEAQYREGDFFSAVRGNNEFFETTCRDVEFWQPLPEPPCK